MKMSQIRVGGTYAAKVSNAVVPVTVLEERTKFVRRGSGEVMLTYWRCRSVKTGREIVVKSAQRFRQEVARV